MADDELKRLLEGLFSDIPTETVPTEAPSERVTEPREARELREPREPREPEQFAARFQAAARLSHAASSILSLDELLPQVVELIREEFDYYYVGIFLVDEDRQWAVLQAGTGEAGQQMLEQGHRLRIGNDSMIGWCIAHQQARVSLDVRQEAFRFINPLLPETRSEMGLPLISRGRVIGAMTIQSTEPAAFSHEDITILQTMADQLANAIENARLFQERERRITELAIVNEIGQALSTSQSLDELLEAVHQQVSRLFDTTNFYIATYNEGDDVWASAFHLEGGKRQPQAQYSIQAGLTGHIIRTRQPLLFRTAQENIAFNEGQGAQVIGEIARSWLGVPLITADKLIGVMGIQDYQHERLYGEDALALFSTLAAQVATALDNLRLLEEARRRAQQREAINEVGRAVTSVLDLDAVLRQIVDITKARFDHYYVSILLVEGDRLVFRAGSTVGDSDVRVKPAQTVIDLLQGPSLNAEAARTRQPVLVNDVRSDPRFLDLEELPGTRAELDVPIEVRGRVIGVLGVQSQQPNAYDQVDVALLQSLASQVGVAIENARLFEETQRRVAHTQLLLSVSEATASTLESTEVMRRVARAAAGALGADTTAAYVLDETERNLRAVAGYHVPPAQLEMYQQTPLPVQGVPFIEEAIHTQHTVYTSDTTTDTRYDVQIARIIPARSVLLTPMIVKGEVIGMLWAVWWEEAHPLTEEEQRLVEGIVRQAAIAIDSARLFDEIRHRADEFGGLHRVSLELAQEQQDLDTVLDTISRQAMDLLDSDGGGVWLWREEDHKLELVITYQVGDIDFTGRRLKPGEGLTGHAFTEREVQVIDDYLAWAGRSSTFEDAPFVSGMAVPMIWQAQVVGVLVTTRSQPGHPYTANEQHLAELLAAQAAAVIQNARLFDETQQRVLDLTMVSNVSEALASAPLQAEEIAAIIARQFVEVMDVPEASLSLLDPAEGMMRVVADYFVDPLDAQIRREEQVEVFRLADYPATARVMERLEPLVVQTSDPDADPSELAYMEEHEVTTLAIIPLAVKGQAIGVIELEAWEEERQYTPQQLNLALTLANQAAVALENARLLEQTRLYAEEQALLRRISEMVSRAAEMQTLLDTALDSILKTLDFDAGLISLSDAETGQMYLAAQRGVPEPLVRKFEREGLADTLCEFVFKSGESLGIEDVRQGAPVDVSGLIHHGFCTYTGTPLAYRGRNEGTICLFNRSVRQIGAPMVSLMEAIGREIAMGVGNARLFEGTQRRLEELTMLSNVSQALAGAPLQAEEIGAIVARQFVEVMGVSEASISLPDPEEEGTMRVVVDLFRQEADFQPPEASQKSFRLADYPATARVMEGMEPIVVQISDPHADPAELAYMQEYDTMTLAVIPLVVKGQAIGVIELESSDEEYHYTQRELDLAMTLANQAAVALENARLFQEAQVRAEEQAILRRITEAVSRSLEMEDLLQTALAQLLTALGFDAGLVSLWEEDTDQLYLVAEQGLPEPMARSLEQEGLAGTLCDYVFRVGETVFVSDVRQGAPVDVSGPIKHGLFTYLGIPLEHRGTNEGTICLFNRSVRETTSHQIALLEEIGRQIAVGVENARLFEQTQAALSEVEATHRGYLRRGWQDHLRQREMLERSGFVYDRIQAEQPESAIAEPNLWRPEIERALAEGSAAMAAGDSGDGERSGLAVPINLRGQTFGVLGVESPTGDHQWSEDDIALMQAVGDQLAQTLETARLFADTQRRAERERLISEITTKIRASADIEDILETTAVELGRALGTSRALVRLSTKQPTSHQSGSAAASAEEEQPEADGEE